VIRRTWPCRRQADAKADPPPDRPRPAAIGGKTTTPTPPRPRRRRGWALSEESSPLPSWATASISRWAFRGFAQIGCLSKEEKASADIKMAAGLPCARVVRLSVPGSDRHLRRAFYEHCEDFLGVAHGAS